MTEHASRLHSHWAARPWAPGETRLHWYLLPALEVPVRAAVADLQARLARPGLDLVPPEWLHATIRSLRPVPDEHRDAMVDAVRAAVAATGIGPITATAAPLVVDEAVVWALRGDAPEPDAIERLHTAVTTAVGPWRRTAADAPFRPHVTVAYAAADLDGDALRTAMGIPDPVTVRFDALHLLEVRQDGGAYRWEPSARLPLPGP